MKAELKENERIDDLQRNGYRIIQNSRGFCFGMDAVLLSAFACETLNPAVNNIRSDDRGAGSKTAGSSESAYPENAGRCSGISDMDASPGEDGKISAKVGSVNGGNDFSDSPAGRYAPSSKYEMADLGTGTGIIALLMHAKLGSVNISALEIQDAVADMAERSVMLNDLSQQIKIVRGDIREASSILGRKKFDIVTSNPPYMKADNALKNPNESKAISRHEILMSFEDLARETAALLKSGGKFYLVHRPQRLTEIIETLRRYRLEPKRLKLVHSTIDDPACMVLIEAVLDGGVFLKVEKPLIIYKEKGVYTDEIYQLYGF